MALGEHLQTLKERHDALDNRIATLSARPSSDDLEISKLKRKKLLIKDQIEMAQ